MRLLRRYIGTTVISATGLVLLVIAALQIFITFLSELHTIGWGHYGIQQAFVYVMLSLPQNVYPLFPAAALIGALIGLSRLAAQSELVVMRAAGMSKWQITAMALRATVWMLILATLIGEGLAPYWQDHAEQYRDQARQGSHANTLSRSGFWIRSGNSFIYMGRALSNGEIRNVIRYQFDHLKLHSVSVASKGTYQQGHWILYHVHESLLQDRAITARSLAHQILPLELDPKLLASASVNPEQTTLWGLYDYIRYLRATSLSVTNAEFDAYKRLFQPIMTLIMIGLAVPFILGPLRNMTMGLRIVIGVGIGFGFFTLNEFLGPFSLVYNMPPLLAATIPMLLFGGLGGLLLYRGS